MAPLIDNFSNLIGLLCGAGMVAFVALVAAVMFIKWIGGIADGFGEAEE